MILLCKEKVILIKYLFVQKLWCLPSFRQSVNNLFIDLMLFAVKNDSYKICKVKENVCT